MHYSGSEAASSLSVVSLITFVEYISTALLFCGLSWNMFVKLRLYGALLFT